MYIYTSNNIDQCKRHTNEHLYEKMYIYIYCSNISVAILFKTCIVNRNSSIVYLLVYHISLLYIVFIITNNEFHARPRRVRFLQLQIGQ